MQKKEKNRKYVVCRKCGKFKKRTRHHIFPQCFFGKKNTIMLLCPECHQEIETIVPKGIKRPKGWYYKINMEWLEGAI